MYLSNAPFCSYPPSPSPPPTSALTRRCWCLGRDGCNDRGVLPPTPTPSPTSICTCDKGFVRLGSLDNAFCERYSYPNTFHLQDQFGINNTAPTPSSCSATYVNNIPAAAGAPGQQLSVFCANSSCTYVEGHYYNGGCNNPTNNDIGRVGAKFDRIVPANYVNNSYTTPSPAPNWAPTFNFAANSSTIPQNSLFRGMGKFLLDDVFSPATPAGSYFNENGLRTGTDPSNPTEFKNLATSWIDAGPVYRAPAAYSSATVPSMSTLAGSYANPSMDIDEKAILNTFFTRHNQLVAQMMAAAPCSSAGKCSSAGVERCIREVVILELRAVAAEFLTEAKNLPGTNWNTAVSFPPVSNAPVELAAAHIFDFHFAEMAPSPLASCCVFSTPSDDPSNCLSVAQSTPLNVQISLTGMTSSINAASEQVKSLGLGSVNTYLHALNLTEISYASQNANLLVDLHGSAAEYAINFGILQSILNQDSRAGPGNATATCSANLQFTAPADTASFNAQVNSMVTSAQSRSMCTLLQAMSNSLYSPLGSCVPPTLHRHMFRADEAATGTC